MFHDIFFFFFPLTGTFDLQHHRNVFSSLFDSVEIPAELQQSVWSSEDEAAAKSYMERALCVLITVYGWPRGHEKWSTKPLIIQCGCWIGTVFILGCRTTIIHLLKSEDPNSYFCLLITWHTFHPNSISTEDIFNIWWWGKLML